MAKRRMTQPAYSYRDDAGVPGFDDRHPIAFMDGACVLCMTGARLIDRMDRSGTIRICPVQSALGQAVLRHYGLDTDDPDSWLFLDRGYAYGGLEAMIRVGQRTGGAGHLLRVLRLLPAGLQGWLYRRLARNRYWMFGRRDSCELPTDRLRARLIS